MVSISVVQTGEMDDFLTIGEASDPVHIFTPEARAADDERIEWMEAGDHRRIVETMDDYLPHNPKGTSVTI